MTDESVIVEGTGTVFLAGPPLVRAATGERVTAEELGGAAVHTQVSGLIDHHARDDAHALELVRSIVAHVPQVPPAHPWVREAPIAPHRPPELLDGFAPSDPTDTADLRAILACVLDDSALHEFKPKHGTSLACGFGHVDGWPVGVLGASAALTAAGARKGAHFVQLCGQRRIPLVVFQHVAGAAPPDPSEPLVRDAGKLASMLACTAVPIVSIVVGAPGGPDALATAVIEPRFTWLWPSARTIDPNGSRPEGIDAWESTAQVFDDGIIEPSDTRAVLARSLAAITINAPIAETSTTMLRM